MAGLRSCEGLVVGWMCTQDPMSDWVCNQGQTSDWIGTRSACLLTDRSERLRSCSVQGFITRVRVRAKVRVRVRVGVVSV